MMFSALVFLLIHSLFLSHCLVLKKKKKKLTFHFEVITDAQEVVKV